MGRVSEAEKTRRLNRARSLLEEFQQRPDCVERLRTEFAISIRQAYRYLREAQQLSQHVPVPDDKAVLSVRIPRSLILRLREGSAATGTAVSELVSRALRALFASAEWDG